MSSSPSSTTGETWTGDRPVEKLKTDHVFFTDLLGKDIVTVTVGERENKKEFVLHATLLCQYSDYFAAAFNRGFRESTERKISLPEEDPSLFRHVVQWLYAGALDKTVTGSMTSVSSHVRLYTLADRLQMRQFQIFCYEAIRHGLGRTALPSEDDLKRPYAQTAGACELRTYFADLVAYDILGKPFARFRKRWDSRLNSADEFAADVGRCIALRSKKRASTLHPYESGSEQYIKRASTAP